jgi:predicted transcriptional regulator
MPRKPSPTLTDAELRLMEVLWNKERATVADIVAALPPPPIHYSTVLTTMRILERKGFVRHFEDGRTYVYEASVDRDAAADSALGHLVNKFFRNSPTSLALRLVSKEKPSREELARLKALIDRYEDEQDARG